MKTKINTKMVFALFAIISFFALSSFLNSPDEKKQYATLRVFEPFVGQGGAAMSVVYEDGKTEEFDFNSFKPSILTENTKKINALINSISSKGYDLLNTGTACGGGITVYTFVKK